MTSPGSRDGATPPKAERAAHKQAAAAAKGERRREKAQGSERGTRPKRADVLQEREREEILRRLHELADGDGSVIAGPFLGEVGFELLYWIPFLRWAVREVPALRGRLVLVSRGGTHHWSAGLGRYVDVYELYSPAALAERRPGLKQRAATALDLEVAERVRERLGEPDARLLHPGLFFESYYRLTKLSPLVFATSVRETPEGLVGLHARFEPLPPPPLGKLAGVLPDDYVAVRFYFRRSFPDSPENRAFAADVIATIARSTPVVLLNNGLVLDDHRDLRSSGEGVVTIDHLMAPEDNLHVQTVAISRARAFVGTYGGLAYVGPFLSVPSLAFDAFREFTHPWHTQLARAVFAHPSWGALVELHPRDLGVIDRALSISTLAPAASSA